jgi:hypothetical protein
MRPVRLRRKLDGELPQGTSVVYPCFHHPPLAVREAIRTGSTGGVRTTADRRWPGSGLSREHRGGERGRYICAEHCLVGRDSAKRRRWRRVTRTRSIVWRG